MFYLAHQYFTSSVQYISAEKVYAYFKEFLLRHSIGVR